MDTQRSSTRDTGIDSKIAHAYDESIARAQVMDADDDRQYDVRDEAADILLDPLSRQAYSTESGIRETDPTTLESKLGPGEELRDREFPAPAGTTIDGGGSGKLLVDQNSLPDDESRRGGRPGSLPGDVPRVGIVPSIIDQDAAAPDLAQEQG